MTSGAVWRDAGSPGPIQTKHKPKEFEGEATTSPNSVRERDGLQCSGKFLWVGGANERIQERLSKHHLPPLPAPDSEKNPVATRQQPCKHCRKYTRGHAANT